MVSTRQDIRPEELVDFFKKWRIVEASTFTDPYQDDEEIYKLLVVFEDDAPWTLFDLVRMEEELSAVVGETAHIATRAGVLDSASDRVRHKIFGSARLVYAG